MGLEQCIAGFIVAEYLFMIEKIPQTLFFERIRVNLE